MSSANRYKMTIEKNGQTITTFDDGDLLKFTEGKKLLDALEEAGYPPGANDQITVNGESMSYEEAEDYEIEDDVEVSFTKKVEGGGER